MPVIWREATEIVVMMVFLSADEHSCKRRGGPTGQKTWHLSVLEKEGNTEKLPPLPLLNLCTSCSCLLSCRSLGLGQSLLCQKWSSSLQLSRIVSVR